MPKIANRQMRDAVNKRQSFTNNNFTAFSTNSNTLYVVWSYGRHYPMYVYDKDTSSWFGNDDKSTRTTNRHKIQTRPDGDIKWCTRDFLHSIIDCGSYAAHCARVVARRGPLSIGS
jgi:hypothetical protein